MISIEKKIGNTDYNYSIITAGAKFAMPKGIAVTLECEGCFYNAKMHSTTVGRIDGLSALYKAHNLQVGDEIRLTYDSDENVIHVEKVGQSSDVIVNDLGFEDFVFEDLGFEDFENEAGGIKEGEFNRENDAKVGKVCPKCKTELPDSAKYCFKCGAEVNLPTKAQNLPGDSLFSAEFWHQLEKQAKEAAKTVTKGVPVMDYTPNGGCDCATGECDCDGSIWN